MTRATRQRICRWMLAAILTAGFRPSTAAAQAGGDAPHEGAYIGGGVFESISRFSGDPSTNVLNGAAPGAAARAGVGGGSHWDLEAGIEVPSFSSHLQPHPITYEKAIVTLQARTSNRAVTVPGLLRYHDARRRRVQIGYLAGLSFLHLRRTSDTVAPADTPPSIVPKRQDLIDYGVAPILGLDARIRITPHVSVIPEIRATAFNLSGLSALIVRPGLGLRWTF